MKLSRFTVTLTLCLVVVKSVTAKPEAAILQSSKVRQPNIQTLNTVSSTIKPDNVYSQQHVTSPQQYIQQNVIQQPLRLHQVPVQPQFRQQFVHPVPPTQNVVLPSIHPQTQQQILQFVQRALYTSQQHQQPTAMIIIAQPALIPAHMAYGNPSLQPQQQHFQYYPAQTQNRYQYIQQQPIPQPIPQPVPQQSISQYQMVPVQLVQQYHHNAAPVQIPTARAVPTQEPEIYNQQKYLGLDQISQVAQAAAQKYFNSNSYQPQSNSYQPQANSEQRANEEPVNSLPPIITGLENFTPEQQAKIKEQLSAHFGAPLQPLHLSKDIQKQIQEVQQNDNYQSTERTASGNTSPFVPSVELKSTKGNSEVNYTKRPGQ